MIWIIGEYAERIDNADELLEQFLETFPEETSLVSLCLTVIATSCSEGCWEQHSKRPLKLALDGARMPFKD